LSSSGPGQTRLGKGEQRLKNHIKVVSLRPAEA
jgi:hypothetical protein